MLSLILSWFWTILHWIFQFLLFMASFLIGRALWKWVASGWAENEAKSSLRTAVADS